MEDLTLEALSNGDKPRGAWEIERVYIDVDEQIVRKCPFCGSVYSGIKETDLFCTECGADLSEGIHDANKLS